MSLRSIHIASQAINSQSQKFGSISENIANMNTTGYKKSTIHFSEVVNSQQNTTRAAGYNGGGTPGNSTHGGVFGGMSALATRDYMHDGQFRKTANSLDMAIKGSGQFIVREYSGASLETGGATYLTSAGNMQLMPFYRNGVQTLANQGVYLADQNGYNVMGQMYNEASGSYSNASSINQLQPIRFDRAASREAVPAIETSVVTFAANLPSDTPTGTELNFSMNLYTGQGKINEAGNAADPNFTDSIPLTMTFKKLGPNLWGIVTLNSQLVDGKEVGALSEAEIPDGRTTPLALVKTKAEQELSGLRLQFDGDGKPLRIWDGGGKFPSATSTVYNDLSQVMHTIKVTQAAPNALIDDPANPGQFIPNPTLDSRYTTKDLEVNLDLRLATSYGGENTMTVTPNGRKVSVREFKKIIIGEDGVIYRTFDDNSQVPLARLVAGVARGVNNLEMANGTLSKLSANSGEVSLLQLGVGSSQKLMVGTLEESDVDLAESFSDMIINQRAYSVSAKALTTAVEMQERALELKR